MHSRISGNDAAELLEDRGFSKDDHTVAACNVCENAQVIESQTVVDRGETPLLEE